MGISELPLIQMTGGSLEIPLLSLGSDNDDDNDDGADLYLGELVLLGGQLTGDHGLSVTDGLGEAGDQGPGRIRGQLRP